MNIADPIAQRARATPGAIAIVAGRVSVKFAELDRLIDRVASHLQARGVLPGAIIGLSVPGSPLHLIVVYALARLGAIQLALPPADSLAARTALARRFGVQAVVCHRPQDGLPDFPQLRVEQAWLETAANTTAQPAPTEANTPWKIVLSSGTTGAPKAILATHASEFGWHSRGRPDFAAVPDSRLVALIDMNFSYGLRLQMHALNSGACVVLSQASKPIELLDEINANAITHLATTPRHLIDLAAVLPDGPPRCLGLRYLSVAGAIMPENLRQIIRSKLTPNLHVKYGSNEVGYLIEASPELIGKYPDVLGRVVAGVQHQIVDQRGEVVAAGDTGIIRFRGQAFPQGYMGNPEATAIAFRDGWFAPGDLAREGADGEIYFMGRADDMINFDGVKLYPVDIEARLLEHPSVAEAAAFPMASARYQDLPAAAVVLRPNASAVTAQELLHFCDRRLGLRAPRIIRILDALPKNELGKVQRRKLAEAFAADLPAALE